MKKALITIAVFVVFGLAIYGIGVVADPATGFQAITDDSPCPVTGCASGECHGFESIPEPDGIHEMTCPEVSCSSTECHAWDTLMGRYRQASDASLNVWILMPTVLIVGLIVLVNFLSKDKRKRPASGNAADQACDGADFPDASAAGKGESHE